MADKLTERQLEERRSLFGGFGKGQSEAFELALVPFITALVGFGLDHVLGLLPILTATMALFGLAGIAVKVVYGYSAQMRAEQAKLFGGPR